MRVLSIKSFSLFFLINISILFITLIFNDYTVSYLMPLEIMGYGIGIYLVYTLRRNVFKSVVVDVLFITYFLKMVLLPFMLVITDYNMYDQNFYLKQNLNAAVMLSLFEYASLCVFVLCSKTLTDIIRFDNCTEYEKNEKINIFVKVLIFIGILIALLCVVLDNSVLTQLALITDRFLLSQEQKIEQQRLLILASNNATIYFHMFALVFVYLQMIIPAFLMSYIVNKRDKKGEVRYTKGYILCLFVSVLSAFVVTSDNRDSVFILLACIMVTYSCYYEKMKKHIVVIGAMFLISMFSFLLAKTNLLQGDGVDFSVLAQMLSAYFQTLPSISISFAVEFEDKFATFLGDIVSGVPYLTYFFRGLPKSVTLYNELIFGSRDVVSQIMPLISWGYHYFGILAPIVSLSVFFVAIKIEKKYKETSRVFNKVLYAIMFANLAIAPSTLGFPSVLKRLCWYVPVIILLEMNKKRQRW